MKSFQQGVGCIEFINQTGEMSLHRFAKEEVDIFQQHLLDSGDEGFEWNDPEDLSSYWERAIIELLDGFEELKELINYFQNDQGISAENSRQMGVIVEKKEEQIMKILGPAYNQQSFVSDSAILKVAAKSLASTLEEATEDFKNIAKQFNFKPDVFYVQEFLEVMAISQRLGTYLV